MEISLLDERIDSVSADSGSSVLALRYDYPIKPLDINAPQTWLVECERCLDYNSAGIDDMSKTISIGSTSQFNELLKNTKILVADCMLPRARKGRRIADRSGVYAEWCGPCKAISPHYEQLSAQLSRPQKVSFAKVDTEQQQEIARRYGITA